MTVEQKAEFEKIKEEAKAKHAEMKKKHYTQMKKQGFRSHPGFGHYPVMPIEK